MFICRRKFRIINDNIDTRTKLYGRRTAVSARVSHSRRLYLSARTARVCARERERGTCHATPAAAIVCFFPSQAPFLDVPFLFFSLLLFIFRVGAADNTWIFFPYSSLALDVLYIKRKFHVYKKREGGGRRGEEERNEWEREWVSAPARSISGSSSGSGVVARRQSARCFPRVWVSEWVRGR